MGGAFFFVSLTFSPAGSMAAQSFFEIYFEV